MEFDFSEEKNQILLRERGVTFQDVISAILDKGVLADFPHPNTDRYPNQHILVVEIDGYTCCVPYVIDGGTIFSKLSFQAENSCIIWRMKNDCSNKDCSIRSGGTRPSRRD